jgi:hypothetical protein
LFHCRSKSKSLYGLVELMIGCVIAVARVNADVIANSPPNIEYALAFVTGSFFLAVRGITNINESLANDTEDPIARRWINPVFRSAQSASSQLFKALDARHSEEENVSEVEKLAGTEKK